MGFPEISESRKRPLAIIYGSLMPTDWLELNAVEKIVSKIKENEDTDVVLLGYSEHHPKNKIIPRLPDARVNSENTFSYYLQHRMGVCPMALGYVYSRSFLLENNILFAEQVYFEDTAFTAKVAHFTKNIQVLPISLYNYNRQNMESITKSFSKKKIKDLIEAYDDIKEFMVAEGILAQYQNLFIARFSVFGLAMGIRMYYTLPKEEQKDGYFERELFSYRKSPLLARKTLNGLMSLTKSFEKGEKEIIKRYRANLGLLWWVKNAFGPLRFINRITKIWQTLKVSV